MMELDTPTGTEVTWQQIVPLLQARRVAQITVVNKSVAKVELKSAAAGTTNENEWKDTTTMDFGTSSTASTTSTYSSRAISGDESLYFHIGSVERLEDALTQTQQELGWKPKDFVPIQYISETNWAAEIIKASPAIAMVALTVWLVRSQSRMAGGGVGGPGGI
ncbi:MAG: hypothetical protein AAGJ35_15870, partial [Myxococcota bacterium]